MLHKVESKSPTVAAAFVPSEVLRNKLWDRRRFLHLCFGYQIPGFLPSHLINDSDHCLKKKKRELKKLFSPQSLPPLRRKTHHVIEIFSSFFFKLDTSLHIPFILSCSDSFKNCCFVDPEWPKGTGGLSTEAWREHTAPRRVVKPTSSPVFRHQVSTVVLSSPRILIPNRFSLLTIDTLFLDLNVYIILPYMLHCHRDHLSV